MSKKQNSTNSEHVETNAIEQARRTRVVFDAIDMDADVPVKERFERTIPYTRSMTKATDYLMTDGGFTVGTMIRVVELIQEEYERRVYDAAGLYSHAYDNVSYDNADLAEAVRTTLHEPAKVFAVDLYTYSGYVWLVDVHARNAVYYVASPLLPGDRKAGEGAARMRCEMVLNAIKQDKSIGGSMVPNTVEDGFDDSLTTTRTVSWDRLNRTHKRVWVIVTVEALQSVAYKVYKDNRNEE